MKTGQTLTPAELRKIRARRARRRRLAVERQAFLRARARLERRMPAPRFDKGDWRRVLLSGFICGEGWFTGGRSLDWAGHRLTSIWVESLRRGLAAELKQQLQRG